MGSLVWIIQDEEEEGEDEAIELLPGAVDTECRN